MELKRTASWIAVAAVTAVVAVLAYLKMAARDAPPPAETRVTQAPAEPPPPVHLVQPKVLYEYADRALEARSAGQKIMMRLGHENGQKVRAALRELRGQLEQRSKR